jgi:hypothetical protein
LESVAELAQKAETLNEKRRSAFGGTELALVESGRVRTENNCVPRDVVSVAGHLLFGFHVFLGLRAETQVKDVLSLQRFERTEAGVELGEVPHEGVGAFLADATFQKEFRDAFKYGKDSKVAQLRHTDARLLVIVQVGEGVRDTRVFRWAIDAQSRISYVDSRGEEDDVRPAPFDFDWTQTTREQHVAGKHPHVNVLDEVFVETIGGDLTVKVENNTASGAGVYREPVDDANQTLDDGDIAYARLGTLILLRIKPFREDAKRYLVFNTRTQRVARIDAVGLACRQLPEDHGIVFPGGYYLRTGESKIFEGDVSEMELERVLASPNGEDVLYVFYRHTDGLYLLMPYNVIRKEVATPIRTHGYSLSPDGTMVVFRGATEATRVHPIQVWRTPFTTAEHAASAPTDGSYIARIGNADLVRGISDALSIRRLAATEQPTRRTYEDLVASANRVADAYYWLGHADVGDLLSTVRTVQTTAELVIDEFEKIVAIKKRADEALAEAETKQRELLAALRPEDLTGIDAFLGALTSLRKQRGALITLKEMRSMEVARVEALEADVRASFDQVSASCVTFLLGDQAFAPLLVRLEAAVTKIEAVAKANELGPFEEELDTVQTGLTLLGEVVNGLAIADATARTRILEGISTAFAQQNRARAVLAGRKKDLSTREGRAEFAAQFKLLGQAVTSALSVCDSPAACDRELSRLLLQLEDLEGRFGDLDEFLGELTQKRQDVTDALGARRQTLLEERQRRAANVAAAAERIFAGVGKRAVTFATPDELNAYFASDPMVAKLSELEKQLQTLGDTVRADELRSRLLTAKKDGLRALRDKADLIEGDTIKLGHHRFTVQSQQLELTMLPRGDVMELNLTGTDFREAVRDEVLERYRDLWEQTVVSESADVYRAEMLAASMLFDAEHGRANLTISGLVRAASAGAGLLEIVRAYAADHLDEGYERGLHDADAALILERLATLREGAGTLRFSPDARALGCLFVAELEPARRDVLSRRAKSVGRLRSALGHAAGQMDLAHELEAPMTAFATSRDVDARWARDASLYVVEELAASPPRFTTSAGAVALKDALFSAVEDRGGARAIEEDLRGLEAHPGERLATARAWIDGAITARQDLKRFALEAAALLVTERRLDRNVSSAPTEVVIEGVLGAHARIEGRRLTLVLDEFLLRLGAFVRERVPRFVEYRKARASILEREKNRLRLGELQPRVLSSFVRNRLIDEVYLPLVGANFAKQLGAAGATKRTDLMGLLLLVSPPGYGKTTLMEYVADKLGLIFVKVNGPALGHAVTSLDPSEAKSATARQEVDKINLALEMGNNVMLYLDDIQHTSSELLQKFISLCDAQRKIEGVWGGRTKTYDLRGKRFCVVMAGNPYTESGARFQIPDMLANRADTYNLGDILGGKSDLFAESYLENALTSNAVLAPLATREPADLRKLVRMARGEDLPLGELSHGYSAAEAQEILAVLSRMLRVQAMLMRVNQEYIASASQSDAYRNEPPFKLQGSYRNMNKLAEKIVSAMDDSELEALVDDHYASEAQTLTTGAEQNLLKLGDLRGRLSPEQQARWTEIKETYARVRKTGDATTDPVTRVTGTLSGLDAQLGKIRDVLAQLSDRPVADASSSIASLLGPRLDGLSSTLAALGRPQLEVHLDNAAPPAVTELLAQQIGLIERTLVPLVRAAMAPTEKPAQQQDLSPIVEKLGALTSALARLDKRMQQGLAAPLRFEVPLELTGANNFFRGLSSDALGVFVATYEKLPPLGAPIALHLVFPTGARSEVAGHVVFTQDYAEAQGVDGGFGVRLVEVPPEADIHIRLFMRAREPLLRDI